MAIFKNCKKKSTGFSLIEVLVFVSVLNLFFIMALTITVFSLRRMKENEHKIVAVHYLDQLKEWLAYEKEKDGISFLQRNGAYCFNNLDWSNPSLCSFNCPGAACLADFYNRQAVFSNNGADVVNVSMSINWIEIDRPVSVKSDVIFSVWEK